MSSLDTRKNRVCERVCGRRELGKELCNRMMIWEQEVYNVLIE